MSLSDDPDTLKPDHSATRKLAYELWCARGCPDGSPEVDWFDAEKQLTGEQPTLEEAVRIPTPVLTVKAAG